MRRNFFLPASIIASPPNPPLPASMDEKQLDERSSEWLKYFSWANPEAVLVAARLFPLTTAATFGRWFAIRTNMPADHVEAISLAEPDRVSIEPTLDPEMLNFRELIEAVHWVFSETDLSQDRPDYKAASDGERRLVDYVLGFFGVGDHFVVGQLDAVASKFIGRKEGLFYLSAQENQERTHERAYARQISEIIGVDRRDELFGAIRTMPEVGKMADWFRWWTVADHSSADVFAALAFAEGVLFSGFFAAIQHFRTKNKFPGLTAMNELISRDEGIHTSFWCFIVQHRLAIKPDQAAVAAIAAETAALCDSYFKAALPNALPGMNEKTLNQYVRFVADAVLIQMKYKPQFGDHNPFDTMDVHALNRVAKNNFFEARTTAYQSISSLTFGVNRTPVDF